MLSGGGNKGTAMESPATITIVYDALERVFCRLDDLCSRPVEQLLYRLPYPDAWSMAEHLEHISLANHFLLLTIAKGVAIALRRARSQPVPPGESDLQCLAPIADHTAFPWEPPGHMIPGGSMPVAEVRSLLTAQHLRCRSLLGQMTAGEGRLCCFHMSVYNLGKLDMYQWLYFLAQHASWHVAFLKGNGVLSA